MVEEAGEVEIDDEDLQIDTYRASGAGGQHVNKTDSAVRITHRPSGIVVQCQNERSQSSNKATAMAMLRSKLVELEERKRREEIAKERGEAQDVNFGSQIRSYVLHPYTMVKDHRTDEEMGDANRVLDGDLDGFVRAYLLQQAQGLAWRSPTTPTRRSRSARGRSSPATSRPRPTSTRSWPTASAARRASTSPATRRARAPTPGCAPRSASDALMLDVPQDIHGIDLGPEPTPFQRAEQLAAEAHGAARSWFLTNGATQGNHALCLALAPLGAPVVVQRNSHASRDRRARALRRARRATSRPSTRTSSAWPTASRPRRSTSRAARATPDARAAWIVSPTYYGMAADVAGCAEVCAGRRRPARRRPVVGLALRLPPRPAAVARSQQGADAVLTSTHKIVGSLTQSAMLHVAPTGRDRPRRGRPRGAARAQRRRRRRC